MNAIARLSTRGQLVIPKELRDRRGWREGTEVEIIECGDELRLRPASPRRKIPAKQAFAEARRILNYQGPFYSDAENDQALNEMFSTWKS